MDSDTALPTRKRWIAIALSFVAPGLGHVYAGHAWRGLAWFGGLLALTPLIMRAVIHLPQPFDVVLLYGAICVAWSATGADAARMAVRTPAATRSASGPGWYVYLIVGTVVAALVVWKGLELARLGVRPWRIAADGMAPTFEPGDDVLVTMSPWFHPVVARDALGVIALSSAPQVYFIKRIVGVPGDTLSMRGGRLYVDSRLVDSGAVSLNTRLSSQEVAGMEQWQRPHALPTDPPPPVPDLDNWGPVVVPRDSVFLLGDNRANSYDSRFYGFVPGTDVQGQARIIYFSKDPDLGSPMSLQGVRWDRVGMHVR